MAFWLPLLAGLGSLFGGASAARSDAKKDQASTAQDQYRSELAAWTARQNAEANRANTIASRPGQRLAQGALGNMVESFTPPTVSWGGAGSIPKVSGGWGDLKFNDATKQNASLMQRDALMRQMQGQSAPDIASVNPMPSEPTMPSKSWLDTLLGVGGMVGGAAGAYQDAQGQQAGADAGPGVTVDAPVNKPTIDYTSLPPELLRWLQTGQK